MLRFALMGRHFLVTGGAGFIGSHAVERLLARGDSVTVADDFNDFYDPVLKRRNAALFSDRAKIVEIDLRDATRLRELFTTSRFDAILHLAARVGVRPSLMEPRVYTEVNVLGTQHLLELAREFGVKKFVFASSSSVYGMNQQVPFSETDPISKPISPYAATKLAGEALCHVYHHLYGIDIVCLRLFTVYGPRQRPDMAIHKFTRDIASGKPVEIFGNGSVRRDFTYIDDVVQGLLASVDRSLGYEVINLGESETVSVIEMVRLIEKSLGEKADIRAQPAQPGDVPITYANISKANKLLDYHPRTLVEDGIPRFVEWFRQQP